MSRHSKWMELRCFLASHVNTHLDTELILKKILPRLADAQQMREYWTGSSHSYSMQLSALTEEEEAIVNNQYIVTPMSCVASRTDCSFSSWVWACGVWPSKADQFKPHWRLFGLIGLLRCCHHGGVSAQSKIKCFICMFMLKSRRFTFAECPLVLWFII